MAWDVDQKRWVGLSWEHAREQAQKQRGILAWPGLA